MDYLSNLMRGSKNHKEDNNNSARGDKNGGHSKSKKKGMPQNPSSIFTYEDTDSKMAQKGEIIPFEEGKDSVSLQITPEKGRISSFMPSRYTSAVSTKVAAKNSREKKEANRSEGAITLNDKQLANAQFFLEAKLKINREKEEVSSREQILNEINASQARKKCIKIHNIIENQQYIDIEQLRAACWNGIPQTIPKQRCDAWRILLEYMPYDLDFRQKTLDRKRQEYCEIVQKYFGDSKSQSVRNLMEPAGLNTLSDFEKKNLKQIRIDVLRTQPDLKVFQTEQMQCMMIRILFIWAIRHPASAYVQGINDLCAPLLLVFISEYVIKADQDELDLHMSSKQQLKVNRLIKNKSEEKKQDQLKMDENFKQQFESKNITELLQSKCRGSIFDIKEDDFKRVNQEAAIRNMKTSERTLSSDQLEELDEFFEEIGDIDPQKIIQINKQFEENLLKAEADIFWCLSKLIDDIQDNYTEMQPGVHKIINKMKALIQQKDPEILEYLDELGIDLLTFAYRWVSCYLTREFDIYQTIRLWDTYFSEDEGFSQFHCYVCAALFLQFGDQIKEMNFQDALMFLQSLPTREWKNDELTTLLAKSFEMKELYHYNRHLVNQKIEAKQIQNDFNS